jgi:pyroglutamyl-peptidase
MLRRRSKTPKPGSLREARGAGNPRDARGAPGTPKSRRRGRPDVAVPPQLLVKDTLSPALSQGSRERNRGPTLSQESRERNRGPTLSQGRGGTAQEVVLVTGFEPFGGETTNPSWEACQRLPGEIAGMRVERCRVPCEFRRSIEVAAAAIERHKPVLVICVGQAGGRSKMGVERVAINVDDARIPDNAHARPVDEPIAPNGPPAYFATVPVKAMAMAMRAAGAPAEVSNSAGTYVCNHLMYGVLHYLAASGQRARAGFIHVPYSEAQVLDKRDTPGMSVASMVKGIEAAIAAAQQHRHDIKLSEGALE